MVLLSANADRYGKQCCYDLKMKHLILLNMTEKANVTIQSVVSQFVHSPFNRQNVWWLCAHPTAVPKN